MTDDVCEVYASHMVTILGARTWTIGCVHRSLAIVTYAPAERRAYMTLFVGDTDIGFLIDGFSMRKLFQVPHAPGIESEDLNDHQSRF